MKRGSLVPSAAMQQHRGLRAITLGPGRPTGNISGRSGPTTSRTAWEPNRCAEDRCDCDFPQGLPQPQCYHPLSPEPFFTIHHAGPLPKPSTPPPVRSLSDTSHPAPEREHMRVGNIQTIDRKSKVQTERLSRWYPAAPREPGQHCISSRSDVPRTLKAISLAIPQALGHREAFSP